MRSIRVVLDTNVVVSAHLSAEGYERSVLDLALSGKLRIFVSEAILREYESVLRRPKFRLKPVDVSRSLRLLRAAARVVAPYGQLNIARDPGDNRFLECAEAAKADYLVTGNKRHFPKEWRQTLIVNARELLEWTIPEKDSGEEEADPYVLAVASRLRSEGKDGRVVTQETKDTPRKISMNSACGVLGLPSVPLSIFLRFEGIL